MSCHCNYEFDKCPVCNPEVNRKLSFKELHDSFINKIDECYKRSYISYTSHFAEIRFIHEISIQIDILSLTENILTILKEADKKIFEKIQSYENQMLMMDEFVNYNIKDMLRQKLLEYESTYSVNYAITQTYEHAFVAFVKQGTFEKLLSKGD